MVGGVRRTVAVVCSIAAACGSASPSSNEVPFTGTLRQLCVAVADTFRAYEAALGDSSIAIEGLADSLAPVEADLRALVPALESEGRGALAAIAADARATTAELLELLPDPARNADRIAERFVELLAPYGALPDRFCVPPDGQHWAVDDDSSLEVLLPDGWLAETRPWRVEGFGEVGTSIVAAAGVRDIDAWESQAPRGTLGGLQVARSDRLAELLGIDGARTAVALDRLRELAEASDWHDLCVRDRIVPYSRSAAYFGYLVHWRNCADGGAAMVEVYALRYLPTAARNETVMYLRATVYRYTDEIAVRRALSSFHAVTDRVDP